jgi:hypothetical protein
MSGLFSMREAINDDLEIRGGRLVYPVVAMALVGAQLEDRRCIPGWTKDD